jgi:multiple sugar transport system substrate-binding protein
MKKFWSIVLAAIFVVLVYVGSGICSPKEAKLTVWMCKTFSPAANDMIKQRAKEFARKNNVKLDIVLIPYTDFYPKWTAAIESGQTPDVSFFGYQEVGEFYSKGLLMDLSALDKKIEKEQGAFFPSVKAPITFQGKQYAIPLWVESQVLYYRKDMLKAAGFNHPPQTWDEFRKIAKATTDASKGIYGAGLGYGRGNIDCEWLTRVIIASFGGSEVSKDGKKVTIYSPGTLKAAKFISDLFLVDKSTPPSSLGWDDSGNNKAYLSGQAAMIFNVGTVLAAMKNDNPDLYAKTGIAMVPAGPKGRFAIEIVNNFGIFKSTKNPQLAQKFIRYCLNKDWYGKWLEKGVPHMAPVYQSLANDSLWQDPMYQPFIQQAKYFIFAGYRGEYSPQAGKVFNLRYINDAFQRMLIEKVPPKKAIKELQRNMEKVYKK